MERVLIIEDNVMMRLFLTNYLSHEYEVVVAQTPQEGMCLLNGRMDEFSLVISDYYAPDTPEAEAIGSISLALKWQNKPLIILTDQDKSNQRIGAFESGANDCISKPFNPMELTLRMKRLIAAEPEKIAYRPVA